MKKVIILALLALSYPLYAQVKWSKPCDISEAEVDLTSYKLSVNSKGSAVAIWVEDKMIGPIKSATKLCQEEWERPNCLSLTNGLNPKIIIDEENNIIAIWTNELPYGNVLSSYKPCHGSWEPVRALTDAFALHPQISLGEKQTIYLTWKDKESGQCLTLRKPYEQDWSFCFKDSEKDHTFSLDKAHFSEKFLAEAPFKRPMSHLQALYDEEGDLFVLFKDLQTQRFVCMTKTSQEGWSKPSFLNHGFIENHPIIALSTSGQIFTIWQDNSTKHLYATTGIWEKPKKLEKSALAEFFSHWW